jgi:OmcA/MtrC family decaheme c-type cytochrome
MYSSIGQTLKLALLLLATAFLFACSDGKDGLDGQDGAAGAAGADGQDGVDAILPDPVALAIESAKLESCATCHAGAGDGHQAIYDKYVDESNLELTFQSVTSVGPAVDDTYVVTLAYSISYFGMPFDDAPGLPSLDQKRFYAVGYSSDTGQYLNSCSLGENHVALGNGMYTVQDTNCPYAPEQQTVSPAGAHVYGYVADGALLEDSGGTGAELPAGTHVHLYDDVASAALAWGTGDAASPDAYVSAANVSGCEKCHGTPYMKHGYRDPIVAGIPDFASCKSCHYDDRNGGHNDWQYMVDAPLDWATGADEAADYSYLANVMNDAHMSHAMEFPYPQSMSTCNTCHEGKLTTILDNSNFTAQTCQSCHAIQGVDAWPGEAYAQGHRAPPFEYLWNVGADLSFHDVEAFPDCVSCHGAGIAPPFSEYHSGYDKTIYDASGVRYADAYTVSVDQITLSGNLLTINFSASDPSVIPDVLVSFYGWDAKQFILASHTADGTMLCFDWRGNPAGCQMEYTPESSGGSAHPLFTEDTGSVPGNWMVTLDMAAYVPVHTDDIPTMIANGEVKKVEVTVTPELVVGDEDVVLTAAGMTFDLGSSMVVDDYFKGANATVDTAKCNVCHDSLASSFHDGSGRGGDGIEVCKNCHVTTSPGSHVEMASRAIDSYTHAIHSFQDFDVGDTFETFDPVLAKRYDQHITHVFPNFTIRNCEACHVDGTYNIPDQSESMPGVQAKSDAVATWYDMVDGLAVENAAGRKIGSVPEFVSGPASRACGACHRSRMINDDLAGALGSFNAHTDSFGTLVENDDEDEVVYGVIDKLMSLFE